MPAQPWSADIAARDATERFLVRQPVFDRTVSVCAYRMLYRSAPTGPANGSPVGDTAAHVLADSVLWENLDALSSGRRMFLAGSPDTLGSNDMSLLPPQNVILEVPSRVQVDDEFVDVCRRLKSGGYKLAIEHGTRADLLLLADVLRLDIPGTPRNDLREIARRFLPRGVQLLADRVDTHEEFDTARCLGFTQFHGEFFARPVLHNTREVPAFKVTLLRVLRATSRDDMDLDEVEALIKQDPALAYKMLRYVNSAWFGSRSQVDSVRHMVMMLGEREIRRWSTLVLLSALSGDKPPELSVLACVRARFCELLAPHAGVEGSREHLFLAGLLSTTDAMLDRPMTDILHDLQLASPVVNALQDPRSREGGVFGLVRAYESGDWMLAAEASDRVGISPGELMPLYLDAVRWTAGALTGTHVGARAA